MPVAERSPSALARWTAAMLCILYGFAKINGSQFTVLDSELARPLGEVSGFWLTWHYFGYSKVYGTLLALLQIGAGILLVVPRTALAGAVLLLPIAANIALIDVFYGVDLGATAAALVLCASVAAIVAPYVRRLSDAAILKTQPRRPAAGSLAALALVVAGSCAFTWWVANYNNRMPTAIDGAWTVIERVETTPEAPQWQQVFFERNRAHLVVFRGVGRADDRHHFEVDAGGRIRIWEEWLRKGALIMEGQRQGDRGMELALRPERGGARLRLQRVTPGQPAVQPGSDERLIREARARSNAAIAAHDPAAMAREWMADVHVVSSTSAQVAGAEANRQRMARQFANRPDTIYIRRPATIDVYEPWAVASERGEWTGRWTEPDGKLEIGGTYQAQWRRIDGRWLIQAELYVPARCSGAAYCNQRPQ